MMEEQYHEIRGMTGLTSPAPADPPPIPDWVGIRQELVEKGWESHVAGTLNCLFATGVDGVRERVVFWSDKLEYQIKDVVREQKAPGWRTVWSGPYSKVGVSKEGNLVFTDTLQVEVEAEESASDADVKGENNNE